MCISRPGITKAYDPREDMCTEAQAMERALNCGDKAGFEAAKARYEELQRE